jgi:hypothetical protein
LDISCAKLCIMPLTKYWWMSNSNICGYDACCMKMLVVDGQWFMWQILKKVAHGMFNISFWKHSRP